MRLKKICALGLSLALVVTTAAGCDAKETAENLLDIQEVFAAYEDMDSDVVPSVKPYKVAADLSNVENASRFKISENAKKMLAENGFLVTGGGYEYEFFMPYEANRYAGMPNFITTDSLLHNYHLFYAHLLRTVEKEQLAPLLKELTEKLLEESKAEYDSLKGTDFENAAKRNVAFFSVAAGLIGSKAKAPDYVKDAVEEELALIDKHEGIFISPVMAMGQDENSDSVKEDYTQYIVRGHYAKTKAQENYFRTMMWYGRLTFRAESQEETKSAALITRMLSTPEMYMLWNDIYETTSFFVGQSDDSGVNEYYKVMADCYGGLEDVKALASDKDGWKKFYKAVKKLEGPKINSMPIFNKDITEDRDQAITGFRFMGQRFTLDANIFQQLIYRDVEENSKGETRMLPKGLDIPAALGSKTAYKLLDDMGETDYKGYKENLKKMQKFTGGLSKEDKNQNLYWSWLHMIEPLTVAKDENSGYPSFMTNDAWAKKQLETYLSSWTELKHDTILYSKPVYAEMGGPGMEEVDDRGYVEPEPNVYGRLAATGKMTLTGLSQRNLISDNDKKSLQELVDLAQQLQTISEKELIEQNLTDDEYELIRSYGGQLEHFWLEAMSDEGVDSVSSLADHPAALIADVANDPNGVCLEEATGLVNHIFVVVPVDGKLRIAEGCVWSYYEFKSPLSERWTDEKWKDYLVNGNDGLNRDAARKKPKWTLDYFLDEEYPVSLIYEWDE